MIFIKCKGIILLLIHLADFSSSKHCANYQDLESGQTYYAYSPNFPLPSTEASCTWLAEAYPGYEIIADCYVVIDIDADGNCSSGYLFIWSDGLKSEEKFCGYNDFIRTANESILIGLEIPKNEEGIFLCTLRTRKLCDCVRTVRGKNKKLAEFPFMAGIVDYKRREIYCGGTIISRNLVLTANHCVDFSSPNNLGVVVGMTKESAPSTSLLLYRVNSIISYPDYEEGKNDIALLRLRSFLVWSPNVGPACLPFNLTDHDFTGQEVDLVGWSQQSFDPNSKDILQNVLVDVISNDECKQFYPQLYENNLCTLGNHTDACQLLDGGPVIYDGGRQYVVGVISFGDECSGLSQATKVAPYLNWIQTVSFWEEFCME